MIYNYSNFYIETELENPVTVENFFKFSIHIFAGDFHWCIDAKELNLIMAKNLVSGQEKAAKNAFENYLDNKRFEADYVESHLKEKGIL